MGIGGPGINPSGQQRDEMFRRMWQQDAGQRGLINAGLPVMPSIQQMSAVGATQPLPVNQAMPMQNQQTPTIGQGVGVAGAQGFTPQPAAGSMEAVMANADSAIAMSQAARGSSDYSPEIIAKAKAQTDAFVKTLSSEQPSNVRPTADYLGALRQERDRLMMAGEDLESINFLIRGELANEGKELEASGGAIAGMEKSEAQKMQEAVDTDPATKASKLRAEEEKLNEKEKREKADEKAFEQGRYMLGLGLGQMQQGGGLDTKTGAGGFMTTIGGIISMSQSGGAFGGTEYGMIGPILSIVGTMINMQGQQDIRKKKAANIRGVRESIAGSINFLGRL